MKPLDYIIHERTHAITSVKSNYYRTKIYEENKVQFYEEDPLTIIKNSCQHYGYTLSIWNELVKDLLQRKSKLPVPVSPPNGIFFVPTTSHRNKHCVWISYYKVARYIERKNKLSIVFPDGKTVSSDISLNQFKLQMKRTSMVIAHFYELFCAAQHESIPNQPIFSKRIHS